jgi:hypothetical protein
MRADAPFVTVYESVRQLAASQFEKELKIPLLPSTTGRVGAADPVRDAGEVGHGT